MPFTELMIAPFLIGISHSAESDHLVAVGNLVNVKGSWWKEAARGANWGLGHTISILAAAACFSYLKAALGEPAQWPFELLVGGMLLVLGSVKLYKLLSGKETSNAHKKSDFFHIGLIHGLAGSGSVAVLLNSQVSNTKEEITFLALFGLGTILGMAVISGLFTQLRLLHLKYLHLLSVLVALLSLLYGFTILIHPFLNLDSL